MSSWLAVFGVGVGVATSHLRDAVLAAVAATSDFPADTSGMSRWISLPECITRTPRCVQNSSSAFYEGMEFGLSAGDVLVCMVRI
jgi:hypothetical protein